MNCYNQGLGFIAFNNCYRIQINITEQALNWFYALGTSI